LALSERDPVTVPFADCAAVLRWEDGSRRLIGIDGFQVAVAPWEWHEGAAAVGLLDRAVPADLVVPMGAGDGPPDDLLHQPPDEQPLRPRYLLLALWALISLAFMGIGVSPVDITNHDELGPLVTVGCDRATPVHVLRDGPGPRATARAGPAADRLAEACREEAVVELVLAAGAGVSLAACGVVTARRIGRSRARARSRRRSASVANG
jgi:hypothetical protein